MKRQTIGKIILISIFFITFWFSSKPGNESANQSGRTLIALRLVTKEDVALKTKKYLIMSKRIRKTAHLSLYFLGGVGIFLITGSLKKSIFIVFILGGLDELHQYFVPGRGAQVRDVFIDSLGGILGAFTIKFSFLLYRLNIKNKNSW